MPGRGVGVGYVWAPGYYAGAAWVPGAWRYRGYDRVVVGGVYGHPVYGHGYYGRDVRHDGYRGHDGFRGRR
ncbi:MAG TPA: hypothetical protein VHX37_14685 [Acidobacteriaceae bacterium]|nr:hypothetical protein [Acidobacteriaceae bacterium]